jgi:S-adenosyl-L-methionine hydrolase (adenosine-forming)
VALVTLTTDFGTADGFVGAMKGVLHARAPGVTVVDISHDIPRHDIAAGAHALANAVPYYPEGTIHVAVVDPGVGGERKPVIVVDHGQLFVGPDNGLFSLVAPRPEAAYEIATAAYRREKPSATFHGRDIFAAAAARLAAGGAPEEAGPQVLLRGRLPAAATTEQDGASPAAVVLHVDVFGNLITNLPGEGLPLEVRFQVGGRPIAGLSETYESVAPGELLAYVGSRGTVEIAVNGGNAAELLGAGRGTLVEVALPRP